MLFRSYTFAINPDNFLISISKSDTFKKFFYEGNAPIKLTQELITPGLNYFSPGDVFDISSEQFYKDYISGKIDGPSVASMMMKIMQIRAPGKHLEATTLFDQYVLMEIFSGPKSGKTQTGVPHQFEGELTLDQKILQTSVANYQKDIYGGVLSLLKATEALAKDFRDFFSGTRNAKKGVEILNDIEDIDGLFQDVSGVNR